MVREEIAAGVYYSSVEGNFKKQRIGVFINVPLRRDTITETALLPFLLERGCEPFPDMTALKRRLNMLYGASLSVSAMSVDYLRVLALGIGGVDERYLSGDGISRDRAELLQSVLFRPVIQDGGFLREWMEIQREKLAAEIRAEINDKRGYCLKKADELFFGDDPRALPQNGFEEDLAAIDGKKLYGAYRKMLSECGVEIISIGTDSGALKKQFAGAFGRLERAPAAVTAKKAVPYGEEKSQTLRFDVEQDKYALLYTAGRALTEREQSVLRVANIIFGSSPTSRLFMNVREKESLCYYCSSRPGYSAGRLTVDSGVNYGNIEKLRAAVQRELDDLAAGNISDRELEEAKLFVKNTLNSVEDTPEGAGSWYINAIYRLNRPQTPGEEIENAASVTKEEIAHLMRLFRVNVSTVLTGKGN